MPINTLQNWVHEFNMWLPVDPEMSPLKEQGEVLGRKFPVFVLNDNQKTLSARAKVRIYYYVNVSIL
jgi:RAD54-like protein 2